MYLTLNFDEHWKIEEFRAAVLAQYAKGWLSREEKAIAIGNLDEAAAKLRLKLQREGRR